MPSFLHEALLLLFEKRPSFAPEIARELCGAELPPYDAIELRDASLGQIVPTEYRADLVVELRRGGAVYGIVVEVQLERDEDKRYVWPLYAAALRAKLRCATCVLVVTPSDAVARWAEKPIALGSAGSSFVPLVVGPQAVPRVSEVERARASPELAVLSVQAHGHEEAALELAQAALAAAAGLDGERSAIYSDLVYTAVGQAVRAKLEALMQSGHYEYQSELVRKWVDKGRAEGKVEGKAEGRAEGRLEGKAELLVRLIAQRGITLTDEQRQAVLTCADEATLDAWTERAFEAATAAEVFGPTR